jgi:hypothetical protein
MIHGDQDKYDADKDATDLEKIGVVLAIIFLATVVCLVSCGCSVKSTLTKPAADGSVAQETAQLAVDTRRAVLANGLESAKLIRASTALVETARVEAVQTARAVRLETGETAAEVRCALNRLQGTMDGLDRALAKVTDTARHCAYMVCGSISLVFVALAWRWGRR